MKCHLHDMELTDDTAASSHEAICAALQSGFYDSSVVLPVAAVTAIMMKWKKYTVWLHSKSHKKQSPFKLYKRRLATALMQ